MNKITFEEYEKAVQIIKLYLKHATIPHTKLVETEPVHSDLLLIGIYDLSMRAVNQLNANGISNVGELYDLYHNNFDELRRMRNIGNTTISEISDFINKHPIIPNSSHSMDELKERITSRVVQVINDEFSNPKAPQRS